MTKPIPKPNGIKNISQAKLKLIVLAVSSTASTKALVVSPPAKPVPESAVLNPATLVFRIDANMDEPPVVVDEPPAVASESSEESLGEDPLLPPFPPVPPELEL